MFYFIIVQLKNVEINFIHCFATFSDCKQWQVYETKSVFLAMSSYNMSLCFVALPGVSWNSSTEQCHPHI
jgi:hypothetical protein